MHPYLWDSVRAWPVSVGVAVVLGVLVAIRLGRSLGLSLGQILGFQTSVSAAALLGAKLHSLAERGALDLFGWGTLVGDGFRYPGGILAALIAVPVAARLWCRGTSVWRLADLVALSIPFAMIPIRFGCFLYGCCFGTVSELPWTLRYPPGSPAANYHLAQQWIADDRTWSLPVHPVHFYFLVLDLVTAAALLHAWRHRDRFDGQIMLLFLVIHEFGKFLVEFFRADDIHQQGAFIQTGPLALSVLAFVVLMAAVVHRRRSPAANATQA